MVKYTTIKKLDRFNPTTQSSFIKFESNDDIIIIIIIIVRIKLQRKIRYHDNST